MGHDESTIEFEESQGVGVGDLIRSWCRQVVSGHADLFALDRDPPPSASPRPWVTFFVYLDVPPPEPIVVLCWDGDALRLHGLAASHLKRSQHRLFRRQLDSLLRTFAEHDRPPPAAFEPVPYADALEFVNATAKEALAS